MKTVTIGLRSKDITGNERVHDNVSFTLTDDKAEALYTLFTYIQSNMVSIFNPELSASHDAIKDKVGKMQLNVETTPVIKPNDLIADVWSDKATKNFTGTIDMDSDNLEFVGMLIRLATNEHVITKINTQTFIK